MPFLGYEPALLQLMKRAREDACAELRATRGEHGTAARMMMSLRLMAAVTAGERDPKRLKLMALSAVDGRKIDG